MPSPTSPGLHRRKSSKDASNSEAFDSATAPVNGTGDVNNIVVSPPPEDDPTTTSPTSEFKSQQQQPPRSHLDFPSSSPTNPSPLNSFGQTKPTLNGKRGPGHNPPHLTLVGPPPAPRNGLQRPPGGHSRSVSFAGPVSSPLRNTFVPSPSLNGANGAGGHQHQYAHSHTHSAAGNLASPYRASFPNSLGPSPASPLSAPGGPAGGHLRTRSISAYASTPGHLPSPLTLNHSNGYNSPGSALPSSSTLPNASFGQQQNGLGVAGGGGGGQQPVTTISPYLPLDSSDAPSWAAHASASMVPPSPITPNSASYPPPPPSHSTNAVSSSPPQSTIGSSAAAARHKRLHSRNLSVFFPRPGMNLPSTVPEDGGSGEGGDEEGQELEIPSEYDGPSGGVMMPNAGSSVSLPSNRRYSRGGGGANPPITPLGQGFKFGGRPPPGEGSESEEGMPMPQVNRAKRRGHHHKHSLSHNFFSFLEPGTGPAASQGQAANLHSQPTPTPVSPWAPISAFPDSAAASGGFPTAAPTPSITPSHASHGLTVSHLPPVPSQEISTVALGVTIAQFVLGASMWVVGQQIGSLSVTGLGYWIVFDSFGVGVSRVVPGWLEGGKLFGGSGGGGGTGSEEEKKRIKRPYGNGRYETVLLFTQAVYLMFSSVYVCKETVEHLLLSAGGEGHHHHSGDEIEGAGIEFPIFMVLVTFLTVLATSLVFDNNSRLVNISGNRLPSLHTLIRTLKSKRNTHFIEPPPTHPLAIVLSNPYAACPLAFCVAILGVGIFVAQEHHRHADLLLSSVMAVFTFNVAYKACVVLGVVLLQTSPPRGLPAGKMESFLRAMREVERHPHVVHLPAPHIWQLTASTAAQKSSSSSPHPPPTHRPSKSLAALSIPNLGAPADQLVVTLEVHVKKELGDDDVLALTKWVWERVVNALGGYKEFREVGEVGGPEVTVGVVRG
ncbi:hypothetical protein CC1G_07549 [Coprinopsis cinerea okayama7|uniref:Uncharacterized protein n=1 Tax=Coprinopsis cinerea (strain Okayama-7 / 130 / ATCC MYA-4618 / FGSC 9003) TaxID=240176 RepID=A8P1A2_COPC7|nr:hypothetical protein CC1G_07549 [Coprinopsis cinerea okayama7\|eukprot:XP_001838059.1 hypothetical protein CC1G_07549 [Coprinopsis cinerea okayama7\